MNISQENKAERIGMVIPLVLAVKSRETALRYESTKREIKELQRLSKEFGASNHYINKVIAGAVDRCERG